MINPATPVDGLHSLLDAIGEQLTRNGWWDLNSERRIKRLSGEVVELAVAEGAYQQHGSGELKQLCCDEALHVLWNSLAYLIERGTPRAVIAQSLTTLLARTGDTHD